MKLLGQLSDLQMLYCQTLCLGWQEAAAVEDAEISKQAASGNVSDSSSCDSHDSNAQA